MAGSSFKRRRRRSKRRRSKRQFGIVEINGVEVQEERVPDDITKKYLINVRNNLIKVQKKFIDLQKNHNFEITLGSFLLLLFLIIYNSFDNIKNKNTNELMFSLYTFLVGSHSSLFIQNAFKDSLYTIIANIKTFFSHDAELEEIQSNFQILDKKGLIDEKMQRTFKTMVAEYNHENKHLAALTPAEKINLKTFLKLFIDLTTSKEEMMNHVISTDYIESLISDLTNFIDDYGSAKKQLQMQIIDPIILNLLHQPTPPKAAVFLVGNPGVGKTRFVNELSKKIKGSRVLSYDYKEKGTDEMDYRKPADKSTKSMNVITQALFKNDGKPIILFFDEFDKHIIDEKDLLKFFLDLLGESGKKEIYDRFLGSNVPIPNNLLIVCASNTPLSELCKKSSLKPLQSRLVEIFIPDMTKDIQLDICLKYISSIMPGGVSDEDKQFVRDVIYATSFPGMRELITIINTYVQQLTSGRVIGSIKRKMQLPTESDDEIRKNYIEQIIAQQTAARELAARISPDTTSATISDDESEDSRRIRRRSKR